MSRPSPYAPPKKWSSGVQLKTFLRSSCKRARPHWQRIRTASIIRQAYTARARVTGFLRVLLQSHKLAWWSVQRALLHARNSSPSLQRLLIEHKFPRKLYLDQSCGRRSLAFTGAWAAEGSGPSSRASPQRAGNLTAASVHFHGNRR